MTPLCRGLPASSPARPWPCGSAIGLQLKTGLILWAVSGAQAALDAAGFRGQLCTCSETCPCLLSSG